MVLAQDLLDEMADMPDEQEITLVDRQVVSDIIRYMPWKLIRSRKYYDRIWAPFDADTVEGVGEQVWDFLKYQVTYHEEDDEEQRLSTPKEMLERGDCDCKGYALFIGGIVDAINRNSGQPEIQWCFRFVPSEILGTKIGHVFVVLDPGGDEVWVDPVLGAFNQKPFYMVKKDKYVGESEKVSGLAIAQDGRIGELVGGADYNPVTNANLGGPFPEGTETVYGTATWIPDGYPLLTQPWLTSDGRLVLRPYAAPPPGIPGGLNAITAYVLAALQVAVNKYAPSPYNVNFSTSKMSGAFTVQMSLYPPQNTIAQGGRSVAFSEDPDWLALPKAPSSLLDTIQQVGKDAIDGTFEKVLNAAVPGLGSLVINELNQVSGGDTAASNAFTAAQTANLQTQEQQIVDTAANPPSDTDVPTWQSKLQTIYQNPLAWVLSAAVLIGIGFLIVDDE